MYACVLFSKRYSGFFFSMPVRHLLHLIDRGSFQVLIPGITSSYKYLSWLFALSGKPIKAHPCVSVLVASVTFSAPSAFAMYVGAVTIQTQSCSPHLNAAAFCHVGRARKKLFLVLCPLELLFSICFVFLLLQISTTGSALQTRLLPRCRPTTPSDAATPCGHQVSQLGANDASKRLGFA